MYVPVYQSVCLTVSLSVCLSACLLIYIYACLYMDLSVCLFIIPVNLFLLSLYTAIISVHLFLLLVKIYPTLQSPFFFLLRRELPGTDKEKQPWWRIFSRIKSTHYPPCSPRSVTPIINTTTYGEAAPKTTQSWRRGDKRGLTSCPGSLLLTYACRRSRRKSIPTKPRKTRKKSSGRSLPPCSRGFAEVETVRCGIRGDWYARKWLRGRCYLVELCLDVGM